MRTNVALLNILNNPKKTLLSLAGIGTAILLIFMQLGFRGAVENTATNIYGKMDFDILLRSPDYLHFMDSGQIERRYINEASALKGIADTNFMRVTVANWRNPQKLNTKAILIVGIDPLKSPFRVRTVDREFSRLTAAETILIDTKSNREFGPENGRRFSESDVGLQTEIANRNIQIVGLFEMGAGLAANGAVICNEQGFRRIDPLASPDRVNFGLLKLRPGESAANKVAEIKDLLARNNSVPVDVLTRQEVVDRELKRWLGETPIGFIFNLGVLISFVVGAVIVYMVLGNDVANRLHEYATMRAMGYSMTYLAGIVLRQAGYLACFAFGPALVLSLILYGITGRLANISLEMTWERVGFVLLLTVVMSAFSGALALKKLMQVAPAELF
jgi:putative ABC transport system permease protein